jgi:hypothetical protein
MGRSVPGGRVRARRFLSFQRMPFITLRGVFPLLWPHRPFSGKSARICSHVSSESCLVRPMLPLY